MQTGKPSTTAVIVSFILITVGLGMYHMQTVKEIEELKTEVKGNNLKILEMTDVNNELFEELSKTESEYQESLQEIQGYKDKVDELEKNIKGKDDEIESLKKDLQAKKAEEKRIAEANDKSEVLSSKTASNSERKGKSVTTSGSSSSKNRTLNVKTTFYSAYDGAQVGITRGGTNMANGNIHTASGHRIIAVDPNTIPFGSIVRVTTSGGDTFMAKADDTGAKIKGNRIDIAVSTPEEAFRLGRGTATVEIVE